MKKICILLLFSIISSQLSAQYNATVALDGSGTHTSLQAAINAAPTGLTAPYTIFIKNGKYKEQVIIPSNKPFIQLIGESVANVILYFDSYAGAPLPGGGTVGTQNSASFTINASDFTAINITFSNTFNYDSAVAAGVSGTQAVAVTINADRAAFKNCRFTGNQDTLYAKGSGTPRHYFKNCYIDGIVDFIFGSSIALFDSCIVYAKSRLAGGNSYITAANTPAGQIYGYVFRDCRLPANSGNTLYYLGRPWQNSTGSSPLANNKTVFLSSVLPHTVRPEGWATWDAGTNTALIYYGEYKSKNTNGTLANVASRAAWSFQLSQADSSNYTFTNLFGSWNPCSVASGFCNSTTTPLVVSNFRGTKGSSSSSLDWNISWPVGGVTYELFRSTDNNSFSKINEVISAVSNDTAINFNLTDALPAAGSIYYYYLKASKTGFAPHTTDTIRISSAPTINATGVLGSFIQSLGTPSATQSYIVSGVNLVANVTITPPVPFEISNNGGINWYTNSSPLVLTPSGNTLSNTTITVRLNSGGLGNFSGNIVHTTTGTGAGITNLAVSGSTTNAPLINYINLQQWPLTANNQDDAGVRSPAVTASTSSFNRLFSSNGTTVTAVQAYSSSHGQAFGASSNGDGSWGTAVGGPGGNVNRTNYVQYTVTANAGYTIRVDSILLNAAFYNTSSNTRIGIVYSKSNFVSDSANISGVISPYASSDSGSFTKPVGLLNQTSGPTAQYRFALNESTGVQLVAGETLTFRIYMSCGSTSTGRYGMLKNVIAKGAIVSSLPLKLISFTAGFTDNKKVKASWTTSNEINTDYFSIERSSDGRSFQHVGNVTANNRNGTSNYEFIDQQPINGISYYRLKMIDKDGSFNYSRTVVLNSKLANSIALYPNPAISTIAITHRNIKEQTVARIVNAMGQTVRQVNLQIGSTQTNMDIADLLPGSYIVILNDSKQQGNIKFIKK